MNRVRPKRSREVRLVDRLLWLSPVGVVVSMLITGFGYLEEGFGSAPDDSGLIVQYGFAVVLFAVPSVCLFITSIRKRRKLAEVDGLWVIGILASVGCLIVGSLVSVPPLSRAVSSEITTATLRAQEPTEAETAYTPNELKAAAEQMLAESITAISGEALSEDDSYLNSNVCRTSNLALGTFYLGGAKVATALTDEQFRSAITDQGHQLDLTVTSSPTAENPLGMASVTAEGGIVEHISFDLVEGGAAAISFETVCVLVG